MGLHMLDAERGSCDSARNGLNYSYLVLLVVVVSVRWFRRFGPRLIFRATAVAGLKEKNDPR